MSDPVALYTEILAAMRGADDTAALKYFDPDFVVYQDPGMPYGGDRRGGDAFIQLRRQVYGIWGPGCMKLQYVTGDPEGNHAAAHFKLVGQPAGAPEPIEGHVIVAWTFRNDLAVEARVFYYDTPRLSKFLAN